MSKTVRQLRFVACCLLNCFSAADEDDPDTLDDDPIVEEKLFLHPGAVNRIRVRPL
jgi:hypothetical protein